MHRIPSRLRATSILTALVALMCSSLLTPFASAQTSTPDAGLEPGQGVIQITGTGTVTGTPDTASIFIGVQASETSLTDAQKQITDRGAAITKVFTDAGVAEKDIQTVNYSINPVANYDRNGNYLGIKRYDIVLMYSIKVRDLNKAGTLLDGAVKAGANVVGGISLYVEDMDPLTQQARTSAIGDARQKAETYAKGTDMKIVGVRTITETSAPMADEQTYQPASAQNAMSDASGSSARAAEVPISGGSSSITVTVAVEFIIEPAG